jgi:GTP-binding protein HflX
MEVLGELGAAGKPSITVFNKVDAADTKTLSLIRTQHPEALFISVHTGQGMDRLLARCEELAVDDNESATLLIPHNRYDVVARLHGASQVRKQESLDEGVKLTGRFPRKLSAVYAPFIVVPPAKLARAQRKKR